MNRETFFDALDRAMTKVAEARLSWLILGMEEEEVAGRIEKALIELDRLGDGIPPKYTDAWVALFYMTWYQPKHIVLAYQLIQQLTEGMRMSAFVKKHGLGNLHIVDFGCGTLATQFAITWAVAEAIEDGAELRTVGVDSYDVAKPMLHIGRALWKQFSLETKRTPGLERVNQAAQIIIMPSYWTSEKSLCEREPVYPQECWLMAMHTIYEQTSEATGQSLARIKHRFDPDAGVLSCHDDPKSKSLLQDASPFKGDRSTSFNGQPGTFYLNRIKDWRESVHHTYQVDYREFLTRTVTSRAAPAAARIYVRRGG